MSPVTPSMTEALIINPSDSFCVVFKKLFQASYLVWKLWRYLVNSSGEITNTDSIATFGQDLCTYVQCQDDEEEDEEEEE